jgi:hypothetical protein
LKEAKMTREEELQRALNRLKLSEIKFLFLALAYGINEDTRFMIVPYGSLRFKLVIPPKFDPVLNKDEYTKGYTDMPISYKTVVVELHEFFDMHIGYSPEANCMVYWCHVLKENNYEKK